MVTLFYSFSFFCCCCACTMYIIRMRNTDEHFRVSYQLFELIIRVQTDSIVQRFHPNGSQAHSLTCHVRVTVWIFVWYFFFVCLFSNSNNNNIENIFTENNTNCFAYFFFLCFFNFFFAMRSLRWILHQQFLNIKKKWWKMNFNKTRTYAHIKYTPLIVGVGVK